MLCLLLGVGFGDQGAAQSIAGIHQPEETLALANTQRELVMFLQARREALAVPEIGIHAKSRGRLAHPSAHFLQLLGGESGRSSGMVSLRQTGQSVEIEMSHPIGDGAWRVSKEPGGLLATHSRSNKQHTVKSVIISGILMAIDFLLKHSPADLGG